VELKTGASVTADELIAWCRKHLAGYKCPHYVVFAEIPKTSTGKLQKFKLREAAKSVS
jgi:fatty-acyl-CoA synthase